MSRTSVRIRRRRLAVLLGTIALVVGLWGPAAGAFAGGSDQGPRSHRHVVQPGETIWSIARSQAGSDADPRPLVDAIVEINGIAGDTIVPGQALAIPAGA
jgi:nucleoid-associated protein YgaU